MPGDGVSFQKNAGYEEDTDDVFPRQAVESNALLSLWASREGWLHGQADAFDSHEQGRSGLLGRVGLQRLPREVCYDQERGESGQSGERHSDTQ